MRADPESQILARPLACPKAHDTGCKCKDFIEQPAERVLTDYQVPFVIFHSVTYVVLAAWSIIVH